MKNHTERRKFITYTAAGAAVASSSAAPGADLTPQPQSAGGSAEPVITKVDVLVVGGGTAGTVAAIQAAREGAIKKGKFKWKMEESGLLGPVRIMKRKGAL
jgi:NADPH-dependent 2,4-dienoyl-CoA reductase/sulfur reductase-like enzyme